MPPIGATGATPVPAARSIRRFTAAAGRRRAQGNLGEVLGDVYYAVISVVIGLGLALGIANYLRNTLPHLSGETLEAGVSLPTVVLVCAVALAGAVLSLSARLGPVGAGGAQATWWLGMPVDRRGLLRPSSLRLPVVAGLVAGLLIALLDGGLLADQGAGHVLRLGLTATLGGAVLVLVAGLAQSRQVPRRVTALLGDVVIASAPVLALVTVLTGWRPAALPDVPLAVLAVLVVLTVGLGWWQDTRLGRIRGRDLREAGSVATQAAGALVSMDSRELGRALTDSAVRQRRRRSRRMHPVRGAVSAVVLADLLVLLRSPRHLVQLVASALVPVVVVTTPRLSGAAGVVLAVLVSGYVGMLATAEGARRAEMAPILDRLLPISARRVRRVRLVVPALGMLIWALIAFTAVGLWAQNLPGWLLLGVVATPVWAGAALRSAYRPAPNWQGPLVATPAGALPGGVLAVLARGPDVAVIGLIPVVVCLALGTVIPAAVVVQALFSWVALAVGASIQTKGLMERMMDMAEQEQRR